MVNYLHLVKKVDISKFPFEIDLRVQYNADDSISLLSDFYLKDRDTGLRRKITFETVLPEVEEEMEALEAVRDGLVAAVRHELLECFNYRGVRVFETAHIYGSV